MNIEKIFIVHYKPLIDRKKYLDDFFLKNGIKNYEFCTDYDRNSTSQEIIDSYFKLKNLNPAQICITISHIEIYKKILNHPNDKFFLILEDDALFSENFVENFNKYIDLLPKDTNIAFLNSGCGLHAPSITFDKIWYSVPHSRTCCSYLINRETCEKLLNTIIPFQKAIDHELNTQIELHKLNSYWCEPTIISDGSERNYHSSYVYF